ncbi:ABC transporter ATP-binding protein [Thermosipho atlanticus]|uniref:ATP-binding cassette, subfamily B n=1 Tax=Thermosipho atlanticus DSM 15807 TaxID=1123380 RepID=A0A1M5RB95_9BACT|nr:ABC transporter ATP-binding protein [Thermosipho atlanticus]SHH23448.1 ATP-binding cassette, subfamily B [Thermosipho atlanticus DSM 15807]
MNNFQLVNKYMKGKRLIYFFAIFATIISSIFTVISPLVIKITVDSIIGNSPIQSKWLNYLFTMSLFQNTVSGKLLIAALIIIALSILTGLFMYIRGRFASEASETLAKRLKDDLYSTILKSDYHFYSKYQSGDIIQRCTSDVETVRKFVVNQFVEIGRTIFLAGMIAYIMFSISLKMAFISTIFIPVSFLITYSFFKKVEKQFRLADEAEAELSTVLQENITGIRVVKAFAREDYEKEKFNIKNHKYRDLDFNLVLTFAKFWSLSDFISLTQTLMVIVIGSYFAIKQEITIGTLVAFSSYIGMLLWPIRQLGRIFSDLGKTKVSLKRINEILSEEKEDIEKGIKDIKLEGNIVFKDVWFGYKKEKPILKGISFEIKNGQTVAFFGSTGSGKSTIISLLLRLYDYNLGLITIDGIELKNISKKTLRENIGVVPQESFLFSKNIQENIKITKIKATNEEVVESAKTAAVHDDIMNFEQKYETIVGEKGVTLSGGQRQRLTIARTIIKEYPILIFDDSLSAVDTETEEKIRNEIKKKSKNRTTILISHRISSVKDADLIVVLDKGMVTNIGTHEELIRQKGLYKKVWEIQSIVKNETE